MSLICYCCLVAAAAAAKSLQSCPTLCDSTDVWQPTRFPRPPEWVAISFSSAWKWKVKMKSLSRVRLSATPWTAAYQAPPSMGFSRQEYWSEVPLPSPANNHSSLKKQKKTKTKLPILPTPWEMNLLRLTPWWMALLKCSRLPSLFMHSYQNVKRLCVEF